MQASNQHQNTANSNLNKGNPPTVQNKPDEKKMRTVTPGNDNCKPDPSVDQSSSNKGQGPAGENL
jgi:hypothetical protein